MSFELLDRLICNHGWVPFRMQEIVSELNKISDFSNISLLISKPEDNRYKVLVINENLITEIEVEREQTFAYKMWCYRGNIINYSTQIKEESRTLLIRFIDGSTITMTALRNDTLWEPFLSKLVNGMKD